MLKSQQRHLCKINVWEKAVKKFTEKAKRLPSPGRRYIDRADIILAEPK